MQRHSVFLRYMETQKSHSTPSSFSLKQLEDLLYEYFGKKAPAMPEGLKEFIVKFGPWITLVMMIMLLPLILAFLGIGAVLMPFSFIGGINAGFNHSVSFIFSIIILVIEAIALPGLFKRQIGAWRLMFYISLLNAVSSVISMNIGGLIIGTLISFYVLFQIKSKYS